MKRISINGYGVEGDILFHAVIKVTKKTRINNEDIIETKRQFMDLKKTDFKNLSYVSSIDPVPLPVDSQINKT